MAKTSKGARLWSYCCDIIYIIAFPCWLYRWPFKHVPPGHQGLILRNGEVTGIIQPGENKFTNPFRSPMETIDMRFQTTELPKIDLCTNSGKITVRPRVCYSIFDPTKALGVTADIESMIGLFVSKYLANRVIHFNVADAKLYLRRIHEPFSNYPAGSPRSTGSHMVDVWVAGWRSGYRAKAIDEDVSGPSNNNLYPLVYDINAQLCRVGTELNCLTFHVVDSVG